jgi:hypothetical protein
MGDANDVLRAHLECMRTAHAALHKPTLTAWAATRRLSLATGIRLKGNPDRALQAVHDQIKDDLAGIEKLKSDHKAMKARISAIEAFLQRDVDVHHLPGWLDDMSLDESAERGAAGARDVERAAGSYGEHVVDTLRRERRTNALHREQVDTDMARAMHEVEMRHAPVNAELEAARREAARREEARRAEAARRASPEYVAFMTESTRQSKLHHDRMLREAAARREAEDAERILREAEDARLARRLQDRMVENERCVVCLEDEDAENAAFYVAPCGHRFCLPCVHNMREAAARATAAQGWGRVDVRCPLCRAVIDPAEVVHMEDWVGPLPGMDSLDARLPQTLPLAALAPCTHSCARAWLEAWPEAPTACAGYKGPGTPRDAARRLGFGGPASAGNAGCAVCRDIRRAGRDARRARCPAGQSGRLLLKL